MWKNDWGLTQYPFVPGHEVIGTVCAVGEQVNSLETGMRVGLGWHAGYCGSCSCCRGGDHNLCPSSTGTIIGRHGGFADKVRASATSVLPLPEGLDPRRAGPLFCGGITVFNPLVQFDISPLAEVAVIGIGGLGHIGLQFLNAWGCRVTAMTTQPSKHEAAIEMGAHDTLNSSDPDALRQAAGRFDLILSTVNAPLDWGAYTEMLKPKGRLHFLGAVLEPIEIQAFALIAGQRQISGSPVGSPSTIARMLAFAAQHGIEPKTEHFSFAAVNEAIEHLQAGKARYRVVLSRDGEGWPN
jgi:uncharacterized zinc-type alcohol dehydrogenase-like protein